jgi:hypothetical protein
LIRACYLQQHNKIEKKIVNKYNISMGKFSYTRICSTSIKKNCRQNIKKKYKKNNDTHICTYDMYGNVIIQQWYRNGLLHRESDKPAYIDNNNHVEKWYKDGLLHRDKNKQPAYIDQFCQKWYKNGILYRENDKPALVYEDDYSITQQWYKDGLLYKEITDSEGGRCSVEKWFNSSGQIHRIGGPAVIEVSSDVRQYEDTEIKKELWVNGNKLNDKNTFNLNELNLPDDILKYIEKFKPISCYVPLTYDMYQNSYTKVWKYNGYILKYEKYDGGVPSDMEEHDYYVHSDCEHSDDYYDRYG